MVTLANEFGIYSLAAAVAFAILYVPLLGFWLTKAITRPIYVHFILTLFCAIRVTAFILRAVLSHVPSDANNVHVLIAYEIVYNTGFFGLLYSAYNLVSDRVAVARNPPNGPISRLLRRRFLFRIALSAAVALGITGAVQSSTGTTLSTINTGNTLRKVAIYIFFVCALLVFLQTCFLARSEFSENSYRGDEPIGAAYGIYFLLVISLLLVVRETFFTATASNTSLQNKEAIWYPLAAVTEFIAVVMFATPSLIPDPSKDS